MKKVLPINTKTFAAAAFCILATLSGCSPSQESESVAAPEPVEPPEMNVLILVLDAFRADMASLYGYDKPTTPHLEKWAKRGTTFLHATSQSTTTNTSTWSFMNGQFPYLSDHLNPIRDEDTPLAELMKNRGFGTASFSDNPYISTKMGFDRGFDTFVNRQYKDTPQHLPKSEKDQNKRMKIIADNYARDGDVCKDLLDEAGNWITEKQDDPWFCYVHILRPHNPYVSPEPFLSRFIDVDNFVPKGAKQDQFINLYEAMTGIRDVTSDEPEDPKRIENIVKLYEGSIAYGDHLANEFLSTLEESGILENTMVIIMSDHGEAFEEHGKFLHGRTYPYQHQVHVPLIVLPPKSMGETVPTAETPVGLVDLVPTLQDVLNLKVPQVLEGQSLVPLMKGDASSFRAYNYFQNLDPPSVGVLFNNHTLMTHLSPDYTEIKKHLAFDLSVDPGEQTDIYAEGGEFAPWLKLTEEYISSRVNNMRLTDVEFSDEEIELMESLGYIQ